MEIDEPNRLYASKDNRRGYPFYEIYDDYDLKNRLTIGLMYSPSDSKYLLYHTNELARYLNDNDIQYTIMQSAVDQGTLYIPSYYIDNIDPWDE